MFFQKYLKYKIKYLKLKNAQIGGDQIYIDKANSQIKIYDYPSSKYDKIHQVLKDLYEICEPNDQFLNPHGDSAKVFTLEYIPNNKIVGFAVITDLKLFIRDKHFEEQGGDKNKKGLFITSVCANTATYRGVATPILMIIKEYSINNNYDYLLLHAKKDRTYLHDNLGLRQGLYVKNGYKKIGEYGDFYIMRMDLPKI